MKKKIRKMSDMQKVRIINKNRNVFWRLHEALDNRRKATGTLKGIDALRLVNFTSAPMPFVSFGAYMANTGTHKRNNR
jgi:hypothetical protein